jgi:hypothetical protein
MEEKYIIQKNNSHPFTNLINKKNSMDVEYLSLIDNFCSDYKVREHEIFSNSKIEFRYWCYRYLNYISNIELKEITLNNKLEAVLIEYRQFPHLEFLIRNTINKLSDEWSHTVVCGNLNYDFIVEICKKISPNIRIIKTNYDNLNQSTYSKLFASKEFWNLFVGEKILIYQEDSCIFRSNINDFLKWDYIGAPWPSSNNDNPSGVGNGGFSLRTKESMLKIIDTISLENTQFNSSTLEYMKSSGMVVGPEDVYFSLNMLKYNIGKVADRDSASKFSTESINNPESLGGHNFWLSDNNWKLRLHKYVVTQCITTKIENFEHRGGWNTVLNTLCQKNFFVKNSDYIFVDSIDHFYLIRTVNIIFTQKWAGIIHCTPNTPEFWKTCDIELMFKNINFLESMKNCFLIIALSNYIGDYLINKFSELNIKVSVRVFKHPVDTENIILFDYSKYLENPNKKLLQIGQQMRKLTSIMRIKPIDNYKKMWLTGTIYFNYCYGLLHKEITTYKIDTTTLDTNVELVRLSVEEYDDILSKNIVFIDLFDASANNTVLECIIRNTPIIINKLPAVIEYLGEDYPLYFNDLEEVEKILKNDSLIKSAHEYLIKMYKEDLAMDYFAKKIISAIDCELTKKL